MVWGAPRDSNGMIEGQIGRSPFDRKRMAVLRGGGKQARTRYRVVEKFGPVERPFASLIECRLETGRTHQIRVHLTHLGHPLIGDPQYGRARTAPRGKSTPSCTLFRQRPNFPARRCTLLSWDFSTLACTRPCVSKPPGLRILRNLSRPCGD